MEAASPDIRRNIALAWRRRELEASPRELGMYQTCIVNLLPIVTPGNRVRESGLRHLAVNIEAIVAKPLSSRTRRISKLLGGLPTAQPAPLASRMKSVT